MRWYYGWNVVAAVFVMAALSFGLGFYGMTVYVATLQHLHGWSAATVSARVTVHHVAGALVTMTIGDVYARASVAALLGLPRDVARLGRAQRRGDQHHPGAVVAAGPPGMESGFGQQPRFGSATSESG